LEHPLRALEARLVYFFFRLRVGALLASDDDLATCRDLFGISNRSALHLYDVGFAFEHCHVLADAFLQGRIGLTQVLALGRKISLETPAWVRRAKEITVRQLRREVRLLDRLDGCGPFLAGYEPFPMPKLECRLRQRLFHLGWTESALDRELASRGLTCPPEAPLDPAENPVILRRLETLVDILAVEGCNRDGNPLPGKTLSVPGRHLPVVVWARARIRQQWRQMLGTVRGQCGHLPPWAVAVLLVRAALHEWERIDPDRIPTERRILHRDDYRCQAPGCTARNHLEVHHIVFRSRGGTDVDENLITLCHAHHHHAVHRQTLRITGRAPFDLTWVFAEGPAYRGEKIIASRASSHQSRPQPAPLPHGEGVLRGESRGTRSCAPRERIPRSRPEPAVSRPGCGSDPL
jgi:hypothetical protein